MRIKRTGTSDQTGHQKYSFLYYLESGKGEVREAYWNTLRNGGVYDRVRSFTVVVYASYLVVYDTTVLRS